MFLGLSNLVNPAAIALTKANAYQAAKVVLGLNEPTSTLLSIAEKYTAFVLPQTNRALTVQQILGDVNFSRFVDEGKNGPVDHPSAIAKVENALESKFGLSDAFLFGIPNLVTYGALGYVGYRYYKKRQSAKAKPPALPAPVAGNPRRRRNCGCRRSK
jgi:hypothetical protein